MQSFFQGWRRKAGCAILAMALALCPAWLRSYTTQDNIYLSFFKWPQLVKSDGGGLRWERSPFDRGFMVNSHTDSNRPNYQMYHSLSFRKDMIVVPYWLVIGPMTLTSAYLILWKPRKVNRPRLGSHEGRSGH